jgi:hypothetical protein
MVDEMSADPEIAVKPFFKIREMNNPEKLHSWLTSVFSSLLEQSQQRTSEQRDNLMLYRGVTRRNWERFRDRDRNRRRFQKINKFVVNHLYDLTETKISQLTRIKPAVEILPTNDEWQDRSSAKVVQLLIKHLWYINNVDDDMVKHQRQAKIFGESFYFVDWNEDKGDLTPAYVAARDAGMDLNDPKIQSIKYTGDLEYRLQVPWRVLLQRKMKFENCEYFFEIDIQETEKLKKNYPDKAKQIKSNDDLMVFDTEELVEKMVEDHTIVVSFWHKKTKEVPEGAKIKFTKEVTLSDDVHPFNHGCFPFHRLTDLDVPEVLNGKSRYETIAPIQRMYNNIQTLIVKNIYLTAHAKWVMPRGAAKIEQLGNDNTIVQYQGNIPPQLLQVQPNSPEVYAYAQQLVQDMQKIYGSHGISRGQVPQGITAASALQFLNELENERATTDIAKHGDAVKDIAKLTIAVAGDMYDSDDGRMVRIVGENNKYFIREFDTAHLHKAYDIRVDNSTGLPETKAAKYQRVLDTMQRHPQMLSPERWTELLDLANVEKMNTLITEAVRAADSETEDLLSGRYVAMPEEWEDHVLHWETHAKAMQSRQFKEEADPKARAALKDHVFWTEEAMIEKMQRNPEFEAKLAQLTLFPLFRHDNYVPARSLEQQMAVVQGQANRGDQVTGQIPGTNIEDIKAVQNAKENIRKK